MQEESPVERPRPPSGQGEFAPLEVLGPRGIEHIPVLGQLPVLDAQQLAELRRDLNPENQPGTAPRNWRVPAALFLATCASTFFVGATGWILGAIFFDHEAIGRLVARHWANGLVYMLAVMSILLAHEMGHFLQAMRYRVPASLPFFIPMPFTPIGTMGAVIGMYGSQRDRRQLFDIGIWGPLAGLIVIVPMLTLGVLTASVAPAEAAPGTQEFGDPLLVRWMVAWLRSDIGQDQQLFLNAPLMAAWVGLLVTGLNMLPISQLDGGHVAYALFGRRAHWLARGVMLAAMGFVVIYEQYGWMLMILLVTMMGADHPPTKNDRVPLGWGRRLLGYASLVLPIICLTPNPVMIK